MQAVVLAQLIRRRRSFGLALARLTATPEVLAEHSALGQFFSSLASLQSGWLLQRLEAGTHGPFSHLGIELVKHKS